jgi:glycosyltransferase involved in cell wall biosynthesis
MRSLLILLTERSSRRNAPNPPHDVSDSPPKQPLLSALGDNGLPQTYSSPTQQCYLSSFNMRVKAQSVQVLTRMETARYTDVRVNDRGLWRSPYDEQVTRSGDEGGIPVKQVAINAVLYRPHQGGVERCIEELVRGFTRANLDPEIHVFVPDTLETRDTNELQASTRVVRHSVSHSNRLERIYKEQVLTLRHRSFPLWHFLGYVMPLLPPAARRVVSVYDITALTNPHLCTRANRWFYGLMLPRTIRRADCIVVPSHYVKEQIVERFSEVESRVRVVPLPLSNAITTARESFSRNTPLSVSHTEGKESLLCVGDLGPKKNIGFLLCAYALLPEALRSRHPLAICGRTAGQRHRFEKMVYELGIQDQVHFRDYVSDMELLDLYRKARLLLYASLDEGYGLPPLEAMALGTPAIVSDKGALPEVGGTAGAIVCPLDLETFSAAIRGLLTDGPAYEQAVARGQAGVSRATWMDYAQEVGRIYAELL